MENKLSRVRLDQETLDFAPIMERITRARVKDCFKDKDTDIVYFVVAGGEMGKALGKGGSNIKRVQQELGKRIKVIEFRDQVEDFVKNVIHPLSVKEIVLEDKVLSLKDPHKKTKSLLIGRDGRNLQRINRAVKRFFDVEIKIV